MANYTVPIEIKCMVFIQVEADDISEAIDLAEETLEINNYCGNGSCEKLIGLSHNIEGSIEFFGDFEIFMDDIETDD